MICTNCIFVWFRQRRYCFLRYRKHQFNKTSWNIWSHVDQRKTFQRLLRA